MKEFCPEKPCQASLYTQGGSMRPVDSLVEQVVAPVESTEQALGGSLTPVAIDLPAQSAVAQYTAPGMRSGVGRETCSTEFAK